MLKRFLIPLFMMAFLLAACGEEVQATEQGAAVQEDSPAPEAEEVTDATDDEPTEFVSECTIVTSMAESTSQYEELFAVTDRDWVLGPEDATLTIVEYGDFQ